MILELDISDKFYNCRELKYRQAYIKLQIKMFPASMTGTFMYSPYTLMPYLLVSVILLNSHTGSA